jgi:hypothetical protein
MTRWVHHDETLTMRQASTGSAVWFDKLTMTMKSTSYVAALKCSRVNV